MKTRREEQQRGDKKEQRVGSRKINRRRPIDYLNGLQRREEKELHGAAMGTRKEGKKAAVDKGKRFIVKIGGGGSKRER